MGPFLFLNFEALGFNRRAVGVYISTGVSQIFQIDKNEIDVHPIFFFIDTCWLQKTIAVRLLLPHKHF